MIASERVLGERAGPIPGGEKARWNPALLFLLALSGCSTLQVSDTYLPGQQRSFIATNSAGAQLRVGIDPDLKFSSFGLVGAPVLPFYVKPTHQSEIILRAEMELRNDQDFSFASRPALRTTNSIPLSPIAVEVHAVALFQDDGSKYKDRQPRWHHLRAFEVTPDLTIDVLKEPVGSRITRARIYEHYHYSNSKNLKWDSLRVRVTYRYDSSRASPTSIEVDAKDLVFIESLTMPSASYHFRKQRKNDYRSIADVGG